MKICIPAPPGAIGGPASFKRKFARGLEAHGIEVVHDLDARPYDLILINAGTRHLAWLRRCKRQGVPIVQRLDGIQWYNRHRNVFSRRRWLGAARNSLVRFTRDHMADHVVYQSDFIRQWWHSVYGPASVPSTIIHNGVDTDVFTPNGRRSPREPGVHLMAVESNLGVHERVIRTPLEVWRRMSDGDNEVRLTLIGRVPDRLRRLIPKDDRVDHAGIIPNTSLPCYLRGASAFISGHVNAACPNTVIEALACGTPVVGFATGALPELVTKEAGACVEYGSDPWKLGQPDIESLAEAVRRIAADPARYSDGARRLAVERYGLDRMVTSYLEVFERAIENRR